MYVCFIVSKTLTVPREVSMYNSTIYIVFSRTCLYGRFTTCCRIRKSVILTKVISYYVSLRFGYRVVISAYKRWLVRSLPPRCL